MQIEFKQTVEFRARLKGMSGGGWKGNPNYIGLVRFVPGGEGVAFSTTIPDLKTRLEDHLWMVRDIDFDGGDLVVKLLPMGDEDDDMAVDLALQIHRDDVLIALKAAEDVPPAAGIGAFSVTEKPGLMEEEKGSPPVDFMTGPEAGIARMFEPLLAGNPNVVERSRSSPISRGLALAMVKRAVQHPAQTVSFSQMPEWLPEPGTIRRDVVRLLRAAGLDKFASVGVNGFLLAQPTEGPEVYEWTRAREPFLQPFDSFQMKVGQTANGASLDLGMAEALEQTKKVLDIAKTKEPYLK